MDPQVISQLVFKLMLYAAAKMPDLALLGLDEVAVDLDWALDVTAFRTLWVDCGACICCLFGMIRSLQYISLDCQILCYRIIPRKCTRTMRMMNEVLIYFIRPSTTVHNLEILRVNGWGRSSDLRPEMGFVISADGTIPTLGTIKWQFLSCSSDPAQICPQRCALLLLAQSNATRDFQLAHDSVPTQIACPDNIHPYLPVKSSVLQKSVACRSVAAPLATVAKPSTCNGLVRPLLPPTSSAEFLKEVNCDFVNPWVDVSFITWPELIPVETDYCGPVFCGKPFDSLCVNQKKIILDGYIEDLFRFVTCA